MAAPRTPAFRGRARERRVLDDLLGRVRDGESAVLVIRGEAGIGKTALMRYCARQVDIYFKMISTYYRFIAISESF